MLEVTLYSGVEFSPDQNNVLCVNAEERRQFLNSHEHATIIVDQFALSGSEDSPILKTQIFRALNYAFDWNYCEIRQNFGADDYRYTYYFITKYDVISATNVVLYLQKDLFQSDFNRESNMNTFIDTLHLGYVRPKLLNSNIIGGHLFHESKPHELDESAITSYKEVEPERIFTSKRFYIAFHCNLQKYGETVLLARAAFSFDNTTTHTIQEKLNSISNAQNFIIDKSNDQGILERESLTFEILNAYVIPEELVNISEIDAMNYQEGDFNGSYPSYRCMNIGKAIAGLAGQRKDTIPYIKLYSDTIKANDYERTSLGTLSNQIEIPNDNITYNYSIKLALSNDIGLILEACGEIKDILSEFEVNFTKNQASSYLAQNKSSIALKRIGNVINTGFSIAGLLKGSPGSINAITQSIMGIVDTESQFADMKRKPPTLSADANSVTNLLLYFGISKFVAKPTNETELAKLKKYNGYNFNNLVDSLDFYTFNNDHTDANYIFIKTAMTNIVGNFDTQTKTYFENIFKRGVRLWLDADNYLKTYEQKKGE